MFNLKASGVNLSVIGLIILSAICPASAFFIDFAIPLIISSPPNSLKSIVSISLVSSDIADLSKDSSSVFPICSIGSFIAINKSICDSSSLLTVCVVRTPLCLFSSILSPNFTRFELVITCFALFCTICCCNFSIFKSICIRLLALVFKNLTIFSCVFKAALNAAAVSINLSARANLSSSVSSISSTVCASFLCSSVS